MSARPRLAAMHAGGFEAHALRIRVDHYARAGAVESPGPQALPPPVSIARNILDKWVAGEI